MQQMIINILLALSLSGTAMATLGHDSGGGDADAGEANNILAELTEVLNKIDNPKFDFVNRNTFKDLAEKIKPTLATPSGEDDLLYFEDKVAIGPTPKAGAGCFGCSMVFSENRWLKWTNISDPAKEYGKKAAQIYIEALRVSMKKEEFDNEIYPRSGELFKEISKIFAGKVQYVTRSVTCTVKLYEKGSKNPILERTITPSGRDFNGAAVRFSESWKQSIFGEEVSFFFSLGSNFMKREEFFTEFYFYGLGPSGRLVSQANLNEGASKLRVFVRDIKSEKNRVSSAYVECKFGVVKPMK